MIIAIQTALSGIKPAELIEATTATPEQAADEIARQEALARMEEARRGYG